MFSFSNQQLIWTAESYVLFICWNYFRVRYFLIVMSSCSLPRTSAALLQIILHALFIFLHSFSFHLMNLCRNVSFAVWFLKHPNICIYTHVHTSKSQMKLLDWNFLMWRGTVKCPKGLKEETCGTCQFLQRENVNDGQGHLH